MKKGSAVSLLIVTAIACSVMSCRCSDDGGNEQASRSKPVAALSCRLYVQAYDPDKSKDRYELMFEAKNEGDKALALLVLDGYGPVPYIRILTREEPAVISPSMFGWPMLAFYVLPPGGALRARVADGYLLAYGTNTADGWVRFKPSERRYHLTATMEIKRTQTDVRRVFVPRKDGRFDIFSKVERRVEDDHTSRLETYWTKWSSDRARWSVPLSSSHRPEGTPAEGTVSVTVSETTLRIEDPSVSAAYGEAIECWSGKLVSNTVELRLD